MRGATAAATDEMRQARSETANAPGVLRHPAGFVPPGPHAPSQPWTIAAPYLPAAWTSYSLGNNFQQLQPGIAAAAPPVVATCLRPCAPLYAPPSLTSTSTASSSSVLSSASSEASSTSSPRAPFAATPTGAIPAAPIPTAALAATVTGALATAPDTGDFATAAAQAAVAAQAAAEAQWRFHQQRLAAQQRAKMRAQAALAMARAQQQATATAESCKRPREEGAGGALSKLDGDCITRS